MDLREAVWFDEDKHIHISTLQPHLVVPWPPIAG